MQIVILIQKTRYHKMLHFTSYFYSFLTRIFIANNKNAPCSNEIKETARQITELNLEMKHIETCVKLKPIYVRYQAARDKEKFLRGYESEITLYETAFNALKQNWKNVPVSAELLKQQKLELENQRTALIQRYRQLGEDKKLYSTVQQNIDRLIDADIQHSRNHQVTR